MEEHLSQHPFCEAFSTDEEIGKMYKRLYLFFYMLLGHREDAEDFAQTTLLKVLYGKFKQRENIPIQEWIFRIARVQFADHRRREARRPMVDLDALDENGVGLLIAKYWGVQTLEEELAEELSRQRLIESIVAFLKTLSEIKRQLFYYKFVCGYSFNEIGLRLGKDPKKLRDAYSKTMRKLKSVLYRETGDRRFLTKAKYLRGKPD